jgi:ubiquinone/menaquinone biosynthesis C-methylase UbiE
MPDPIDQNYLESVQYKDARFLNDRIRLHQRFSTNPYGWFRWVFDQLDLPTIVNILEIGCGPGTLWLENKDRIPEGWRITLSDFSWGIVREARRNIGNARNYFSYDVLNGMAMPFPKNTFDAVIANHMLYHIPNRGKSFAEINRVLKPDGWFFASTIGENHLKELSHIMAGFTKTSGNYYSPSLNPNGFTLENGTEQLALWFKHIEIRHYYDALIITEANPLVAYILSMIPPSEICTSENEIINLSSLINELIQQNGSINIQKSSGMFISKKV